MHCLVLTSCLLFSHSDSFELHTTDIGNARTLRVNDMHCPIGRVLDFLSGAEQQSYCAPFASSSAANSACASASAEESITLNAYVNHILNPVESYDDPLEYLFPDSNVERKVEKLFSLESLGINNNDVDMSEYDNIQVQKFSESIELKDGHYYVALPWKEHLISKVRSNSDIALSVLNRATKNLESRNLLEPYLDVFRQ